MNRSDVFHLIIMLSRAACICSHSKRTKWMEIPADARNKYEIIGIKLEHLGEFESGEDFDENRNEKPHLQLKTVLSYICLGLLAAIVAFVAFRFVYPYVITAGHEDLVKFAGPHQDHPVHQDHPAYQDHPTYQDHPAYQDHPSDPRRGVLVVSRDQDDKQDWQEMPEMQVTPSIKEEEVQEEASSFFYTLHEEITELETLQDILPTKTIEFLEDESQPNCPRRFLLNPFRLCSAGESDQVVIEQEEVKLLIMVTSAPSHYEQRQTVRETWGSVAKQPESPMRLGFVVGTTSNQSEMESLWLEYHTYGDILQVDLEDTGLNQTLKSVSMLCWVAAYCPHAVYFLKMNDDVYANVGVVAHVVVEEPFVNHENFIGGYILEDRKPQRDESRVLTAEQQRSLGFFDISSFFDYWSSSEDSYISEVDYPLDFYPPYASGRVFLTRGSTAADLYDACRMTRPLLSEEDIFVTGLCAQGLGATLLHSDRFQVNMDESDDVELPSWRGWRHLAVAHPAAPEDLRRIWDEMLIEYSELQKTMEQNSNSSSRDSSSHSASHSDSSSS